MGRNDLKFVLENETAGTEVGDKGKTFYRYGMGDFQIWFSQDERNGNIYAAYMHEREDVLNGLEDKFEFYIGTREEARGCYYPNEFQVRPKSYAMSVDEARGFARDLERACDVMEAVKNFFKNSRHYEVYCKGHGIEVENSTRDDLSQVGDELISRQALKDEIRAHFGRDLLSYASDWMLIWNTIEKEPSIDGDLIHRNKLLDNVLDLFGCDLAYYGRDLQFFQDAIIGVPAATTGKVDDLIADASSRSEAENQGGNIKADYEFEK